eukprot:m.163019 g.163019  ORF g.163019 m.163019 type:complete len:364 (-) comp15210_c0_seq2:110-1201(-)
MALPNQTYQTQASLMMAVLIKEYWLLYLAIVAVSISFGLNIGFVLVEHSSHLTDSQRNTVVVCFAVLHEIIDTVLGPIFVRQLLKLSVKGPNSTSAFRWVIFFELVNSCLAPLIGFSFVSTDCLRQFLQESPMITTTVIEPQCYIEESLVSFGYACSYEFGDNIGHVRFKPPVDFQMQRCLSSIVDLYTPAFLVVLAIRIMLLTPGWILMNKHKKPWLLAGASPGTVLENQDCIDAVEYDAFTMNCISIGLCPGLLSPVIAVAAAMCVLARWMLHTVFHAAYHNSQPVEHRTPSIPIECFGYILVCHLLYGELLLFDIGLQIGCWLLGAHHILAIIVFAWFGNFKPRANDTPRQSFLLEQLLD